MDNLKQIAVGVLAGNHWPAHLGLKTDAERIEWLARQVEKLCDEAVDADDLDEKLADSEEEVRKQDDELAEFKEAKKCTSCVLCEAHK